MYYLARVLRALGLLLADGGPTVQMSVHNLLASSVSIVQLVPFSLLS